MFQIPDSESNHWFTSSHKVVQASHGELVVASCCHRLEGLVNSVGRGPDSGKSQIARQQ